MKPNEAKKLQAGNVLAGPRWGGRSPRVVVQEVQVQSPRVVVIVDTDGASWRASDLEQPTPEHEAGWAREEQKRREQQVLSANLARVEQVLGVRPVGYSTGYRTAPVYEVVLTFEQALTICNRLEREESAK